MIVDEVLRLVRGVRWSSETPSFSKRLAAATWGSAVLHGAMWVRAYNRIHLFGQEIEPGIVLLAIPIYSIVFGLIVAAGVRRGSLTRHFAMGVFLPTLAYSLAAVTQGV